MIEIIKHDGLLDGWGVYRTSFYVHVMPINDIDEHEFTKCPCKPYKYEDIIVHNSFDGREHIAQPTLELQ